MPLPVNEELIGISGGNRNQRHYWAEFSRAWEDASQSGSIAGGSPPDELQVWCKVAGINKGKVYGFGSESSKAIGRNFCHDSTSSSVQLMREEIEQLKHKLEEIETERDDLLERMLTNERQIQKNDKIREDGCSTS